MKYIIAWMVSFLTVIETQAQKPKEKSLLWKIEGKDLQAPSYLYGTFHLLCPKDFFMHDTIKQLLSKTNQLYLEIDIDDPELTTKMMKNINMKNGLTIKDLVSSVEYDTISKLFKEKAKIPFSMVHNYKPFMVTSMLYPSLMECSPIAFEKEFEKLAKAQKIEIKGLETIEDQLNVFETIPYQVQAKMLVSTLMEADKSKQQFKQMVELYKSKDIKKMLNNTQGDTDLGKFEKVLLDKRNKNWIPVIENQMNTMPTFFAVGAAHLAGKNGVIRLLRKQGYKVTPIYY